ncbi:hypothetical protein DFH06DRAFT_661253 [Mycena polygramma]|nr:hypothetical protein DFH06DRAFT_661253 [Mycena polygramma]
MYTRASLLILALLATILSPSLVEASTAAAESPVWDLGPLNQVLMDVHNTENYQLSGSQADAQWEALIPASGGLVRVGPHNELFMVSMYHQLRCLDIIRRDYIAGVNGKNGTDSSTRHCINYIRQMVLCRGDTRLEPMVNFFKENNIRGSRTCSDWTQVYKSSQ